MIDRDARPGISGVLPADLASWFTERGHPAYRARQVADAVWRGGAPDAASIPTLPAALRAEVDAAFRFDTIVSTEITVADGGLTENALHHLTGGAVIESVLMHYPARGASSGRTRSLQP